MRSGRPNASATMDCCRWAMPYDHQNRKYTHPAESIIIAPMKSAFRLSKKLGARHSCWCRGKSGWLFNNCSSEIFKLAGCFSFCLRTYPHGPMNEKLPAAKDLVRKDTKIQLKRRLSLRLDPIFVSKVRSLRTDHVLPAAGLAWPNSKTGDSPRASPFSWPSYFRAWI